MISLRDLCRAAGFLAVSVVGAVGVSASTVILDNYTRTGPTETISAPFVSPSTSTANSYSGLVEVQVSGIGWSLWDILNDAFHGVGSQSPLDGQYYQLNMGWTSSPLVPLSGEPANITNFIVFVEGVGAVTPAYTPAYDANNLYHFVVNTSLLTGQQLQFGVSDGIFADNGGSYSVTVWQLEAGAQSSVPDSSAPYAVFALMGVLALARWRQRQ